MHRTLVHLPRQLSRRAIQPTCTTRAFTTTPRHLSSPPLPFKSSPAPPRLPKEEQEIFERLQQQSTGAFSIPKDADAEPTSAPAASRMTINQVDGGQGADGGEGAVDGEGEHPNLRRGAPPEFEGEVNPKTGEVGGPKNEPLRWGAGGDWSFNGRVTDF